MHGAMQPLQGLESGPDEPGLGPQDAQGAVLGSAMSAGGSGQCLGQLGPGPSGQSSGEGEWGPHWSRMGNAGCAHCSFRKPTLALPTHWEQQS